MLNSLKLKEDNEPHASQVWINESNNLVLTVQEELNVIRFRQFGRLESRKPSSDFRGNAKLVLKFLKETGSNASSSSLKTKLQNLF